MISIKLEVEQDQVEQLLNLLKTSNLAKNIQVEDTDDQNLKAMTATDFYKKVGASNLAQKEKRVFSQKAVEEEVKSW